MTHTHICYEHLEKGKVIVSWRNLGSLHEGSLELPLEDLYVIFQNRSLTVVLVDILFYILHICLLIHKTEFRLFLLL